MLGGAKGCCPGGVGFVWGGCCPVGVLLKGGGTVRGVLSRTGSDIIIPPPPVDRQIGVKTLPCPKFHLWAVKMPVSPSSPVEIMFILILHGQKRDSSFTVHVGKLTIPSFPRLVLNSDQFFSACFLINKGIKYP